MKKLPSVKAIVALIAIILINILSARVIDGNKKVINNSETLTMNSYKLASNISGERLLNKNEVNDNLLAINDDTKEVKDPIEIPEIVYDGMTMEELASKLEKSLKSTLKGYGTLFAEYSIKYEVDPYLSLAIVLHETGCYSGTCSTLASKCNNIGGMKGTPGCGGGSYKKFSSLEEGIKAFYKNLSKNYYKKGLTTPEKIGKKYAESETWATRIRYYMNIIENS
jgi:hypothetical protein